MKAVAEALQEIYGLFVEDGSLAIGIVAWLLLTVFVIPVLNLPEVWRAPILFIGLAVLLAENSIRGSKR
jgi:hypothetical protein